MTDRERSDRRLIRSIGLAYLLLAPVVVALSWWMTP